MLDLKHNNLLLIFLVITLLITVLFSWYFYTVAKESRGSGETSKIFVLDSRNLETKDNASHLNKIATDLGSAYKSHDALILSHPSDDLIYTAASLSFMLENITKPVIVTCDPIDEDITKIAESLKVPEVVILSRGVIIKASRATAIQDAGIIGIDDSFEPAQPPSGEEPPKITFMDPYKKIDIMQIRTESDIEVLSQIQTDGVILILGGVSPTQKVMAAVKSLVSQSIVVAHISEPSSSMHLEKAGSINVSSLTPESAYAKLLFLLSNVQDREIIPMIMALNMRGEYGKTISDS